MNALRRGIADCMTPPATDAAGGVSAQCSFPPEFAGFQGHFPGKPVLPAVCMVQAVLAMLEAARGRRISLKSIVSAKWQAPVGPGMEIQINAQEQPGNDGAVTVKARLHNGRGQVAEMKLRVAYAPDGKDIA
jgi:3-hydroxyacyl-[acyl-carrier-protein] dehydratase